MGGSGDATPKDKKESVGGKKLQYRYGNQKTAIVPRQPMFEGKCAKLKGHHVYDCSDARQADLFIKTTKEVAEFLGRTYKQIWWQHPISSRKPSGAKHRQAIRPTPSRCVQDSGAHLEKADR